MKMYETGRLLLEPVLPPLYKQVRSRLSRMIETEFKMPQILDVSGRKSPYTIGLEARVTVIDPPGSSKGHDQSNRGFDQNLVELIKQRRSNIENVVFAEMTNSNLPDEKFEIVVSVEVLEHVEEDEKFVSEVCRVLKPGGVFLMTTPNGDWVENKNPDHKRHYKKKELSVLLNKFFKETTVEYAILGGRYRKMGLRSWSLSRPFVTASSIFGNVVNSIQSANGELKYQAKGTHHLIAVARKAE